MHTPALLVLEDGSVFHGVSVGAAGAAFGEVVFNTAMTGYQEILTDPSYTSQIVTLTYPHIGNVGVNADDEESGEICAAGLIIRDVPSPASNWRCQTSLPEYLEHRGCVAIAGIDTRRLTRILRTQGAQSGGIFVGQFDLDAQWPELIAKVRACPSLSGLDLAKKVTTDQCYGWDQGVWSLESSAVHSDHAQRFHVVVYDFGVKRNILRMLYDHGCRLTVVPATTPAEEVLALEPQGVFLSNGPGDPEPCDYAIAAIQQILQAQVPIFGICLGHQLLALASGAKTVKMKFGHHGANHPVQDVETGRVMITSQNHGFAVDEHSLPPCLEATHYSLFDRSLQGIRRTDCPALSFQGHPEASPGPHDAAHLFDYFIELLTRHA